MDSFRDIIRSGAPIAFAHRGHNVGLPENTLAAFQAAYALGIRFLETDIRTSRDGVPFVFHDKDLQRLAGDPRRIDQMSAAEIDTVRLGGIHEIPRLDALLEAFPDAYLNLDAKSNESPEILARHLLAHRAEARVCIGSFSDQRINRTMAVLGAKACRSLGMARAARFFLAARTGISPRFSADCVQFPMRFKGIRLTDQQTVKYAKSAGLGFHVWTINTADKIRYLMDLGVQGIMSDDCELLKSELQKGGRWVQF